MVSYSVKVVDKDNLPVSASTVIAKQDVWFGETKQTESKTDNNGIVFFDGDIFTTYQISASKNGSNDSGIVRVNVMDTTPETLTLKLFFDPTKGVENILGTAGSELVKNTRTLSIGFAVVGSAVVVLYLLNKASSKSVPTVKIPNKVNLR
tara:strand:- start:1170 stop:1619 length:450 start_codon:yes stop_codon:yes gene_type:complete